MGFSLIENEMKMDELTYKKGYDSPVQIQLKARFATGFRFLVYMKVRHLKKDLLVDLHA